jgi:hypothetical protein
LKFFFDNQLSPHLASAINALAKGDGHSALHLRDKFPADTPDIDWIRKLSEEGDWVLICGDLDITRTKAERSVWKSAGLVGFFLKHGWMQQKPWDQAWRLVKWWPSIVTQAQIAAPGSTYLVQVNPTGKFETL